MATYNLNEVLKQREAQKAAWEAATTGKELALDDISRVKVLSPGRQVFKRFIRNRLAVFGSLLLITMFVFSFIGPLFYSYGQKQIFYKYDRQNVNYALAKENTTYNGYVLDEGLTLDRPVVNSMNSNIKKMQAAGKDEMLVLGDNGGYKIGKIGEAVYVLSAGKAEQVCSTGEGTVKVGSYSGVSKKITYAGETVEGLEEAAAANLKGKEGTFDFNGTTYSYTRGAAKSYDIFAELSGISYTGRTMDAGFESALAEAVAAGTDFSYNGESYLINKEGSLYNVYSVSDLKDARVFTNYTLDTMEVSGRVSDEFKAAALMAAYGDGEFTVDGQTYTVVPSEGALDIYDAAGESYAEFNPFSVRRYSGEDTMEYALKNAVAAKIEEMKLSGVKSGTMVYDLPQQNEDGSYSRDEEGNLIYNETEMKITQRDTGEYVINCDQINYVIDMYAAPSAKHILGTDGDGFDVMARIMYGGRVSLMVGFVVVFIEILLGVIMGGIAGYYGGWVDNLIMRMVDVFYCLPSMPIMIILGAMMDALRMDTYIRLMIMMAALGIMGWAGVARLVRGQILSLREQEFMVATEATGIKVGARIFRHLVPNVMPQLIVTATMGIGSVILTESTLSFLGLGVKHPLATWGTIINSVSSASAMAHYAFIWIPVGLLICVTVIAFNFVGDGLRDAYDPKAKR
ncbi:MAG: ABC transporter permease [Lachnospiraceae bacterium]|nr:ABC transporter permease [Lachnospiraceae bacterium]